MSYFNENFFYYINIPSIRIKEPFTLQVECKAPTMEIEFFQIRKLPGKISVEGAEEFPPLMYFLLSSHSSDWRVIELLLGQLTHMAAANVDVPNRENAMRLNGFRLGQSITFSSKFRNTRTLRNTELVFQVFF